VFQDFEFKWGQTTFVKPSVVLRPAALVKGMAALLFHMSIICIGSQIVYNFSNFYATF